MSTTTAHRIVVALKKRGLCSAAGISTSQARMNANTVKHIRPFYGKLHNTAIMHHPVVMVQNNCMWAVDESPMPTRAEKEAEGRLGRCGRHTSL
jgi:hypothetical protein